MRKAALPGAAPSPSRLSARAPVRPRTQEVGLVDRRTQRAAAWPPQCGCRGSQSSRVRVSSPPRRNVAAPRRRARPSAVIMRRNVAMASRPAVTVACASVRYCPAGDGARSAASDLNANRAVMGRRHHGWRAAVHGCASTARRNGKARRVAMERNASIALWHRSVFANDRPIGAVGLMGVPLPAHWPLRPFEGAVSPHRTATGCGRMGRESRSPDGQRSSDQV